MLGQVHELSQQGVPIADILLNVDAGGLVESEEAVSSGQVEVRIFSLRWDGNESMGQSDGGILC